MKTIAKTYISAITAIGGILILWSVTQLWSITNPVLFLALLALGLIVQATSTVSNTTGTTFSVSQAVNLATLVLLGVPCAILVSAAGTVTSWAINTYTAQNSWKGSITQLAFNTGMIAIVIAVTGALYNFLFQYGFAQNSHIVIYMLSWTLIAAVNDQLNIWLVAIVVYLKQGVHPISFWQQHKWLMPMNMVIIVFGGSILAATVEQMALQGIALFGMPLLLTSYSFRLYIRKNERQLDELRLRSEELEASNAQLGQLVLAKDRFLAVLSHDMRTTLTSIRLYSQMLSTRGEQLTPEKRARMLSAISESERILTGLVDNLLEMEQIEGDGQAQLIPTKIDLAHEVAEVASALELQLVTKNLNLYTKIHQEPLYINADGMMIRKIILNLVSNAIKYTPSSGAIHLNLYTNKTDAVMIVEDTGYGIPKDSLTAIFEPYYRVPEHVNRALGTGLGLSIVKSMVELHGGRIEVASEEGLGSRFTVRLPKNIEDSAETTPTQPEETAKEASDIETIIDKVTSAETRQPLPG